MVSATIEKFFGRIRLTSDDFSMGESYRSRCLAFRVTRIRSNRAQMLRRTKLIGISAANESIFAIYARKEKALLDVLRNVLSLLENKIKKKKKKKKKERMKKKFATVR